MAETKKKINKTPKPSTSTGASDYASPWARLGAAIIDSILIGIVVSMFAGTFSITSEGINVSASGNIPFLISVAYYILMTVNYGATLGKMALKIKVVSVETGENLTYGNAILRELVGKIVSGIVIGLCYFWMLWDDRRQTWHDKIGKSLVVKAD